MDVITAILTSTVVTFCVFVVGLVGVELDVGVVLVVIVQISGRSWCPRSGQPWSLLQEVFAFT